MAAECAAADAQHGTAKRSKCSSCDAGCIASSKRLKRGRSPTSHAAHQEEELTAAEDASANTASSTSTSQILKEVALRLQQQQQQRNVIRQPFEGLTEPSSDLDPEQHLLELLKARGYPSCKHSAFTRGLCAQPSQKQIANYDFAIGAALRTDDLQALQQLLNEGRSLDACNKFGESTCHIACRRSSAATLQLVLQHGGSLQRADDMGRLPLHDTCWATEPRFDLVRINLDVDSTLLLTEDKRGNTPLRYVKRSHWPQWCEFLTDVVDQYWPKQAA
jgi:ankyrin repeat protein